MTELNPDVSLFVSSLAGGGAHKMIVQIAKGLDDLGYGVDIVVVTKEGPFIDSVPEGLRIVNLDAKRALTSVPKLAHYLTKNNPDSLLATPVSVTIPAIWANALSRSDTKLVIRAPTIISKNHFYANPHSVNDRALSKLVDYHFPNVGQTVAISNVVKEDLVNNIGLDPDRVTTIYNPVVDNQILPKSKEPCNHPFFNESTPVIVAAGRLTDEKDPIMLVQAFNKVLEQGDARLILLGEGEDRKKIENEIKQYNIASKVSMPGFVKNPFRYMRRADVFALSSKWEGFGNVIVEAMACGTQVVATDCGGPREILVDGKFGKLVEVGNAEAMSEAILETIGKDTNNQKLISRAKDFRVEKITKEYESVLVDHSTLSS